MSGGLGPTYNDVTLSSEQQSKELEDDRHSTAAKISTTTATGPKTRLFGSFFSFRQLNALAIFLILSASGLVSPEDLAFALFSFLYIRFLSRVVFPLPSRPMTDPLSDPDSKILKLYAAVAAAVGLFLPSCYIFHGIFEGDKSGMKAAAPHVFLLASQVFLECHVASSEKFSDPVRVLVPVFFNSRRVLTLMDWLRSEFLETEVGSVSPMGLYAGKALALANMALWSFNLFGILLPVYLPRAFKRYYGAEKSKES